MRKSQMLFMCSHGRKTMINFKISIRIYRDYFVFHFLIENFSSFFLFSLNFYRLCNSDLSVQSDCSSLPLLAHNLYQNSSALPSSSQSLLHNPYRHLVATQQQNSQSLIGGLNLSASSSATSALTPSTLVSAPTPAQTITTLSNNLYNNNHLYQNHNSTATLTGNGHISKHNSSLSSGASAAISHHHPTPIEGLTALSSLGSSSLHLTNSLCGGSSNSLSASELGMSHWLADGGSNSGMS